MDHPTDAPAVPLLTERDLLIAILNGVSALAKELTGRRLTVVCHTDGGDVTIHGDQTSRLIPDALEEPGRRPSRPG